MNQCKLDDCYGKVHGWGYCNLHYRRLMKHGDPLKSRPRELHDSYKLPEYALWLTMKQRCLNPKSISFAHYGGRGITVCDRWRYSFKTFIQDVGRRPDPKYTLERIDNDKGYEPGNVKWATRTEQVNNRRLGKNNKSGHKGVRFYLGKWRARITVNYKEISLGSYDNVDDAIEAYELAKRLQS